MTEFDLDTPAGRHFRCRDFIECSDTWKKNKGNPFLDNVPVQAESWQALVSLGAFLLDPVWDQFGPLELTYGFSSPSLSKFISGKLPPDCPPKSPGGISPANDQHAACELNTRGNPICQHLGAACDFRVAGKTEGMQAVGLWIAENLPFDSLYYYGDSRPLHLSWSAEPRGNIVLMRTNAVTGIRSPAGFAKGYKGIARLKGAPDSMVGQAM